MIGPSFWLDQQEGQAADQLPPRPARRPRRAGDLPGGGPEPAGGLEAGRRRAADRPPELAAELNIVQREIQLGRSPGEALRQLGDRTDLEEIRSLASVIIQSERFGASLVKSLRVHAETLRLKRQQHAEEMAQKAATKILFPTLLFIFPAIFVVILGPAAFHIMETFGKMICIIEISVPVRTGVPRGSNP